VNLTGTLTGGLTLDDSFGTWRLAGGTLVGGAFTIAPGSSARLQLAANSIVRGVTLNSPIDMNVANGAVVFFQDSLTLKNITQVVGTTTGIVNRVSFNTMTVGGTGTFILNGSSFAPETSSNTLTIGPGITVEAARTATIGFDQALTFNQGTIRSVTAGQTLTVNLGRINGPGASSGAGGNAGTIEALNGSTITLNGGSGWVNSGTLAATASTLNINAAIINVVNGNTYQNYPWTNAGSVLARAGSTVASGSTPTNIVSGTLTGGVWSVSPGATLRLPVAITGLNAPFSLDGGVSNVYQGLTGTTNALAGLAKVGADGVFTLTNGRTLSPTGNFTNAGVVAIGSGSTLAPQGGTYTQTGGRTTLASTASLFTGLPTGKTVSIQGGRFEGSGLVAASVNNTDGTISPGNSPGELNITGNFTQGAGGRLDVEIAGRDPNIPQFDRIRVSGTATLDGLLHVDLLDGFEPAPGDSFEFLTAAVVKNQFATTEFPAPSGPGRALREEYEATKVVIEAQPLPPVIFGFAKGSTGEIATEDVTMDAAGNTYVVGYFNQNVVPADLDGAGPAPAMTSVAISDGFVAKFDPNGNFLWLRELEGTLAAIVNANAVTIDPATGDVIFAGHSMHAVSLSDGVSTLNLSAAGQNAAFVIRLTSDGTIVWGRATQESGAFDGATASDVAVGGTGTIYVTGRFNGAIDFDPGAPTDSYTTAAGENQAFVWSLNASGDYLGTDHILGADESYGESIAARGDGLGGDEIWFTGYFQGTTNRLVSLTSVGDWDAFLVKLSHSAGTFTSEFETRFGAEGPDSGTSVAIGPDGSVVAGGYFQFEVDFDIAPARAFSLTSGGDGDGFLVKLAADGSFLWARQIGGYGADAVNGVALDEAGNIYTTGFFEGFVDFDPLDGAYIGHAPIVSAYVARYSAAGSFGWVSTLDGGPNDYSYGGAVATRGGRVASVGSAYSQLGGLDFDPSEGTALAFPPNEYGGYVWSLTQKAIPSATIAGLPSGALPEGSVLALAASVIDSDSAYFTYSWSVSRGAADVTTGTGAAFTALLVNEGVYTVALTVTDESGNRDIRFATVTVANAAPVLNGVAFTSPVGASPAAPAAPLPLAGSLAGSAMASGFGLLFVGVPNQSASAGAVWVYDEAGNIISQWVSSVAAAGAKFGSAIAVIGDHVAIGSSGSGVVEVFDRFGTLVATINGLAAEGFGSVLASVGNLLAIGVPKRTADGAADAGAAELYEPLSGTRLVVFRNPSPNAGDLFGSAIVSVGGNVLIGAPGDDTAGLNAGAVYLMDPGTGRHVRTATNPNPTFAGSLFGSVLASGGSRAAVGAPLDDSSALDAGGVHVFDFDPNSATFGQLLRTVRSANGAPTSGKFGTSLAFRGNRLLVGAESDGLTVAGSGAAFLFDAGTGVHVFTFKKSSPTTADRFGAAVAFLGDHVAIGAPGDDVRGTDAGAVYRYAANGFVNLNTTTLVENGTLTVSGSFADAGPTDAHTVVIEWGDGATSRITLAPGTSAFSAGYQYLDDGPSPGDGTASNNYTVRVRVEDEAADVLVAQFDAPGADVVRYDSASGAELGVFYSNPGFNEVGGMATGADGYVYLLLTNGAGATPIVRVDPATGAATTLVADAGSPFSFSLNNLALDANGNLLVLSSGTFGNYFRRFSAATGAAAPNGAIGGIFHPDYDPGIFFLPRAFAFGTDGTLLVANSGQIGPVFVGEIQRFDGVTGTRLTNLPPAAVLPIDVNDLKVGPDGSIYLLADAFDGFNRAAFELDPVTGAVQREFVLGPSASPDHIQVADGLLIWSSGSQAPVRFDLTTGENLGAFPGAPSGGNQVVVRPTDSTTRSFTVSNAPPTVTIRSVPSAVAGQYVFEAVANDAAREQHHHRRPGGGHAHRGRRERSPVRRRTLRLDSRHHIPDADSANRPQPEHARRRPRQRHAHRRSDERSPVWRRTALHDQYRHDRARERGGARKQHHHRRPGGGHAHRRRGERLPIRRRTPRQPAGLHLPHDRAASGHQPEHAHRRPRQRHARRRPRQRPPVRRRTAPRPRHGRSAPRGLDHDPRRTGRRPPDRRPRRGHAPRRSRQRSPVRRRTPDRSAGGDGAAALAPARSRELALRRDRERHADRRRGQRSPVRWRRGGLAFGRRRRGSLRGRQRPGRDLRDVRRQRDSCGHDHDRRCAGGTVLRH